MRGTTGLALAALLLIAPWNFAATGDDGITVDASQYAGRPLAADFTAGRCPSTPRGLEQIKGNPHRHTAGAGLAVYSGLVLVTKEGALVIDPAKTCTAS